MKKLLCLFVCILCCFMSACRDKNTVADNATTETTVLQYEEKGLMDYGEFYRIYKETEFRMHFHIYNSWGEIVRSESTDKPLKIDMLNDDLVDIGIGMGTGLVVHRYYSVEKNEFSQEFTYVVANRNELVAYIEGDSLVNRKVVIRNIFDRKAFYREFSLDFSPVDTPVEEATFLEDGTSLILTYLSGKDQTQVTETLTLQDTAQANYQKP